MSLLSVAQLSCCRQTGQQTEELQVLKLATDLTPFKIRVTHEVKNE